ncbi:MAG: nitrogen fixation protein NifZ, partial [Candidatus Competibacteraceae bacterium]|nr:nitrogen fixation protein NifZ [Candidatus Competibacteraceae bacterium]
MRPQFDYGAEVRVTRNIRNDGTYPGMSRGDLLVRRGSTGLVRDIGRFLQDQVIYAVLFPHGESRLVGCREQELIPVDAPWIPNQFEFH